MKWLKFLKAARKRTLEGGAETGATDEGASPHKHTKRRSMQHERKERTSIEQWHEARKSRTSIDICAAFNVTTTERLSVCKAGITLLINRTYIVIKHLGSGSSGQVKLAFNLRSKKLVAIKAVRKGGGGGSGGGLLGSRDARSHDGRTGLGSLGSGGGGGGGSHPGHGHHRERQLSGCGLSGSQSSSALSGPVHASCGGRGWRSITPSSLLRRSASSGVGSAAAGGSSSCRGASPPASSPSPSPMRRSPAAASACAGGAAGPAEDLVREIAILKRLSHPNVVQLVEVIDDPASDCMLLVMGYVEGSTLQPQQLAPGRWRPVPEEVAWRHVRDVLCGLEYLHCHGVVHGDLKPANFIQDSLTGVVRILDFGSAVLHGRVVGEEGLRGAHVPMSCTPGFRSPESLAAGYRPSFELDMWALGVCLYLWIFGELPFKGSAPFVVYENLRSAPLVLPSQTGISSQLTDLLTRLLDKNPTSRMTVHQAVLHPWVTAQGLAPLRTPSPLVMAARMQLAVAAAAAAEEEDPAATGVPAAAAAFVNCQQVQQQFRAWVQPVPLCFGGGGQRPTGGTSDCAASSSLLPEQSSATAMEAAAPVPTPPALLSCSSSSANLSLGTAADAAAADLLLDAVRRGMVPAGSAAAATAAAALSGARELPAKPWTAAAAAASPSPPPPPPVAAAVAPSEGPWRMSAATTAASSASTAPSPQRSMTGMTATSSPSYWPAPFSSWALPRITEGGSIGNNTGSLGAVMPPAAAAAAAAAAIASNSGSPLGARRKSCEAAELRRSVTDEELQAAISNCCDPAGSAAVLMESIFSEVTFPAKHQIICAGDPLDRIYLITAGEVEIYHDLTQDAPCPHKPIIEGLSDPESELDDPGDFLNIRLPGANVPQLERLSTGLLNFTAGGGDRSNHGATQAAAALVAAFGGGAAAAAAAASSGPSAPVSASGYTPAPLSCGAGAGAAHGAGTGGAGAGGGAARAATSARNTLTGLSGKGSGGREPSSSSIGLFSRAGTQTGHLIVAVKGPGDSLGFAGMLPGGGSGGLPTGCGGGSSGSGGGAARQPVWSASVRARTQVTAFVASIDSLHSLARAHPQVEPLLQQMAVQQETDLAVAEAMRSLRLVSGAAARSAAAAAGAAGTASATVTAPSENARAATEAASSAPNAAVAGAGADAATDAFANKAQRRRGIGGGVSSEGESESCGTAATVVTDMTSASSRGGAPPQPLLSSVSEWHRRSGALVAAPITVGGGGGRGPHDSPAAAAGGAIAGGFFEVLESTTAEDTDGVDDVVMLSSELV